MLHPKTLEPGTFSLLKELMKLPHLGSFSLVGGTALALRYGHRSSVDLDLFSHEEFDIQALGETLSHLFKEDYIIESGHKKVGLFSYIRGIKVDIVFYPFKLIGPVEHVQQLRLYSSQDIAAMKIQALLGRGKKKDFYDLYELLRHFSLQQIMDWHKAKYPGQMLAISIPNAITYFEDAEDSETPVSFKRQTWEEVKNGIKKVVRDYLS